MAEVVIQTSFASGEWAPKLRSRVDVAKYRSGAALLRNFFVDYSGGGASTRQGTRFIAQVKTSGARLIPFQASTTVSYIIEFGQNYIRFVSNGAQIISGGVPYEITSPYLASDLFPNQATGNPGLKFVQDANSLIICHPSYDPAILTLNAPTNWTFTQINFGPTILSPTGITAASTLGVGSFDYSYTVTAVDQNGQESAPGTPATLTGLGYLGTVQGTNTISWTAAGSAVSYNVYKALPSTAGPVVAGAQFGFIGNVTGLSFTDAFPGIGPDFSQTPPILQNPFAGASVQSLTLTGNANYTTVPTVTIAAPSSGVQATAFASLTAFSATITHGAGSDIVSTQDPTGGSITFQNGTVIVITSTIFVAGNNWNVNTFTIANGGSVASGTVPSNPVAPTNQTITGFQAYGAGFGFNFTWHIGALILVNDGEGYTSTPTVTITGGATATATLGPASAGNPGVPGFFQERLMLAAQPKDVQGYNLSQPSSFFNFNVSNPVQDADAISGTIISEELNDIRSLIPVPAGIIAMTGRGAWVISGGGGLSTLNPITPANQTAAPQAFNGANDLRPQKINFDVIYGTNKGSYFRDLTYNIYANIFTGADITILSNHLFFGHYFLDIAWSEEPFKAMWIVREDGQLVSLAFVKEQELIGWAHHDTNGQFKSVASVIETVNGNVVDANYFIVERTINGTVVQYIERMADRYFTYGYEDAWSVDCGLQTSPQFVGQGTGFVLSIAGSNTIGSAVVGTISTGSRGWVSGDFVRVAGGVIKINATTTGATFTGNIVRPMVVVNAYTGLLFPTDNWTYWATVTSVSGLTQLIGQQVVGVVDGAAVGPLTVSGGGTVNLPNPGSKVTLGLAFLPQLQTLPLDIGEPTIQARRKKLPAATLRVADTLGLQIGTSFTNAVTMKDFQIGAIPSTSSGPGQMVTDLYSGDGRTVLDQLWQEPGQLCVQQNLPYPATILSIMPEVTVGDTPSK